MDFKDLDLIAERVEYLAAKEYEKENAEVRKLYKKECKSVFLKIMRIIFDNKK